jgi:protein-S-isoprenylcysteine O-methyltransferase Ste14
MAAKGESSEMQPDLGWWCSRLVLRTQRWATRLRIPLGAVGAVVLVVYVDRPPMWPGVLVVAGGELLQIWAAAHLRKNVRIVTSGPYAWMRNPMYVGRFLVGLGFFLLTWRWFIVLGYVVGFSVYAQARVLGEEARLRELFGADFDDYCRVVNRWLPWPPKVQRPIQHGSWEAVWRNHQLRVTAGLVLALAVLKLRLELWGAGPPWG